MTRLAFIAAIELLMGARTDADTSAALGAVEVLAPHARVSDLVFYGERIRTIEQIADEAMLREDIRKANGAAALEDHIVGQLFAVLADPEIPDEDLRKINANMLLDDFGHQAEH
jgi:hypothetical protein